MTITPQQWYAQVGSPPKKTKQFGSVEAWWIEDVIGSAHISSSADLLSPLIMETLPGYGSSSIPGTCLTNATLPVILSQDDQLVGFLALNDASNNDVNVIYWTSGALLPQWQGKALMQRIFPWILAHQGYSILAGTTNVPSGVRLFEHISHKQTGGHGLVVPFNDGPVTPNHRRLAIEILAKALNRPAENINVDPNLVRRRFRDVDLQGMPAPSYFKSVRMLAQRQANTRLITILDQFQALDIGVGDAFVIMADLDGTLHRMGQGTAGGGSRP